MKKSKRGNKRKVDLNRTGKSGKVKHTGKVAHELILSFMVPVCMIVVLGVFSYSSSAKHITSQYEDSVKGNLTTVGMYCDLLTTNVENKASEIVINDSFASYYAKHAGDKDTEARTLARSVGNLLLSARSTCDYIYSYNVISEKGGNLSSGATRIPENAYDEYCLTDEAAGVSKANGSWSGYHTYLDKTLSINSDDYAVSYTRMFTKGNGYLCLDLSSDAIQDVLSNIDSGEGSVSALVTADGREILCGDEETLVQLGSGEKVFYGQEYFNEFKSSTETQLKYVTYHNAKYLVGCTPVGKTGMSVCVLVPDKTIMEAASSIRTITIIIVLLASVVAMITGAFIARGIAGEVKKLTKTLNKASDGDFTTEFTSKRRDEFQGLATGMSGMLENIREIVQRMQMFGGEVNESSKEAMDSANRMADSMLVINQSVEEVASGATKQAEDAEAGLTQMSEFAERISKVYDDTVEIENNSKEAIREIQDSRNKITELNEKTVTTVEMTQELNRNIADVEAKSNSIGSIIATIQEIAHQTNLLSLNASIEAARAGESGRGFAVVAEEIRNLADQSQQAGQKIQGIIEDIQDTTQRTSDCARNAQEYLGEQTDAINDTVKVFENVTCRVEQMVQSINRITQHMSDMMNEKGVILESIESIAAVSEESSGVTQEVTENISGQVEAARKLAKDVQKLSIEVEQLNESLQRFTV